MAGKKYSKYIKPFNFKEGGPGFYSQIAKVSAKSLGFNTQIEFGTFAAAGKVGKEPYGSHSHNFDQVLLWLGSDPYDLGELGAEVEICLGDGDEMEKHVFASSTAVAVPKGFKHFPVTHNRIDQKFIFMSVSCSGSCDEIAMKSKKTNLPAKYSSWFSKHRNKIMPTPFHRKGPWHYGPLNRDDTGGYISEIDFKDFGFNFNMSHESMFKAPYRFGPVPDKPHVHNYHEILLFLGTDMDDLSYLGAECEMSMGKEEEIHKITRPTAVVLPKGFPHCPLTVTKINNPFIFSVVRPFGF